MRAQEVFTPGSFPTHTYVIRSELGLEARLRDGLDTPGQLISIAGPSKSGKTVFVEKVVGSDALITVTGAGINAADQLWERVLDWMSVPRTATTTSGRSRSLSASVEAGGEVALPLVARGKASADGRVEAGSEEGTGEQHGRRGMQQVIEEIADSDFVVLIDDFHYMPRDVQQDVAKQLKEAVRQGVRIITAAVSHRSDDVVRANPELRGRVLSIDFAYWESAHLKEIAEFGFFLLNVKMNDAALDFIVDEASGSPQLVQAICLNACYEAGVRTKLDAPAPLELPPDLLRAIFERTSTMTDFRSLVDALDTGPATRGTERKMYAFTDGTQGDVYRAVLKAMALDPPRLSFSYEELSDRLADLCRTGAPVGSSVISSCQQMSKLAEKNFPLERPIDWDEERGGVLDLSDPYLLFYLRWSSRLIEQ